jgi:predicted phosphohydrolase
MLRGNHDFWWTSLKQIEQILPPSIHLIQNNAFVWNDYVIGGTRLWDTSEYQFHSYIQYADNPRARKLAEEEDDSPDAEKIFQRELGRLELSLKEMAKHSGKRLVMTHYPPISADLQPSKVSHLLEQYGVHSCVFGHLHNVRHDVQMFGSRNGVTYHLTSADYLNFKPLKIIS